MDRNYFLAYAPRTRGSFLSIAGLSFLLNQEAYAALWAQLTLGWNLLALTAAKPRRDSKVTCLLVPGASFREGVRQTIGHCGRKIISGVGKLYPSIVARTCVASLFLSLLYYFKEFIKRKA